MSDPRCTPANGRVAHVTLKGKVTADRFVSGEDRVAKVATTPILRSPGGSINRELLFGQIFVVLETVGDPRTGHAFGYAARDGYCGYVKASDLGEVPAVNHVVAVRETYRLPQADLKCAGPCQSLYLGSMLAVTGTEGDWSRLDQDAGYVPSCHLREISETAADPVSVARLFLGTPYVWGGNSGRGIDCSGLVQAAFLACGWPCPGDSDLIETMAGTSLDRDRPLEGGDLIFWKGHTAMATGPTTMIHANAHHMMVAEEPIEPALARIAASDTGPETSRLRPAPLTD